VQGKWYRRLQVQVWLWAILPLTLVLVGLVLFGLYGYQRAARNLAAERDVALAVLYARRIEDALERGIPVPLVMGSARLGERGVVYLLDADGRVLFHPEQKYWGADARTNPATSAALRATVGITSGCFPDGTATLASFAAVGRTEWRVLVEEPVADVVGPIGRLTMVLPGLVVIMTVLSVLVIYSSLRTIALPVQRLAGAVRRFAAGEANALQQGVGGVEDIRQLQQALRDMVEDIRHYQASIRDYSEGILRSQEAERTRLSRELHDQTVQELIAVDQRLQLAQRAMEGGQVSSAMTSLQATRELSQRMLGELRQMTRALRPVYLDDLGFVPALQALVAEAGEAGPHISLTVQGEARRLSAEVELAAFRVAQEALNNALRHAQAQEISLRVRYDDGALVLTVHDDGIGFAPPSQPDALTAFGHLGLTGMRERTLLAGGKFAIESQPGQGTRITAQFPL
jgi:two-component system sensor histidine kinase UhpB